jgi:acid phosphatase family membrane protein YuiD
MELLHGLNVIGNVFGTIFSSRIFWACFVAWFVASLIKMMLFYFSQKRFDFRLLVGTGGMPSSHSAFVASLATVMGIETSWDSPLFMLALGFAIVTMNDAQGVRRASGHQAAILNRIADDMYQKKPFRPERVKELLGHTPIQVMTGAVIGIVIAVLFYIR